MTCSSATFNPATTHPATLPTEPDDEYFFCVRSVNTSTLEERYAQAKARITDDTLSLVFKVQTKPFAEMIATVAINPLPDFTNAPAPNWTVSWIQKPNYVTRSWAYPGSIENSEKIQRIFFNVRFSQSEQPDEIMVSISSFRRFFKNMNLRESAYLLHWGLKTANLEELLVADNHTKLDHILNNLLHTSTN